MPQTTICLTTARHVAIYHHLFTHQRRSLEGAPGPDFELTPLPDTDAQLPVHHRSGWAVGGPWGPLEYGSRYPARIMVRDVAAAPNPDAK